MKNSYWFISLLIASITLYAYTLWKKRDRKLLALFPFMAGLTYIFEFIILVLFNSYIYYPEILPMDYFDSIVGSVVSNAFTVPIVATYVAAFNLKFIKILIPISIILGIEELFLYLNIYEQFWWKTAYTGIGLIIGFYIAKYWLKKLHRKISAPVRYLTVYMTYLNLFASINFFGAGVFNRFRYSIGWFEHPLRDSVAFATTYIIIVILIYTSIIIFKLKFLWAIAFTLMLFILDSIFVEIGILHLKSWRVEYFIPIRIGMYSIMCFFNRWILKDKWL